MTQIDKATGFPKLPEGYYWHVRKSSTGGYAYITIRKDRLLWGLIPTHPEYLSMICYTSEINTPDRLESQVFLAWNLYGRNFRDRLSPAGSNFTPYGRHPRDSTND